MYSYTVNDYFNLIPVLSLQEINREIEIKNIHSENRNPKLLVQTHINYRNLIEFNGFLKTL